jgi:hypothetical protein
MLVPIPGQLAPNVPAPTPAGITYAAPQPAGAEGHLSTPTAHYGYQVRLAAQ